MSNWATILKKIQRLPAFTLPLSVAFVYLASRLFKLTALPVFADESIYIRWAQLLRHDPQQYLYFALNDGKPPLFIWSIASILGLGADPLWLARLISVVVGGAQLLVSDRILKALGGNNQARLAQMVIMVLAPFWFFHQRMALMDAMLVLWLSVSWLGVIQLDKHLNKNGLAKKNISFANISFAVILTGSAWGLALWTKVPAIFFAGVIFGWTYFSSLFSQSPWKDFSTRLIVYRSLAFGLAGLLGLAIFALLKLQPAFGSLFGRGSDFTFTLQDVLQGEWKTSLSNGGRFFQWLSTYLRPEIVTLPFIAALLSKKRSLHWKILASAAVMALPLIIMGKTVHPRYYLPVAPFFTVSAALFIGEIWKSVKKSTDSLFPLTFWLLVLSFLIGSLRFMLLSYFTPDQTPFVLHDREQYLTEWSSGHGIPQLRQAMIDQVKNGQRLTVVTEGSFGTLPDGILMYFDNRPEIQYLKIEGLAQYPVKFLPDWTWEEAKDHPVWLVVNEHRMQVPLDNLKLIARYPRPYGAPELQVYELLPK